MPDVIGRRRWGRRRLAAAPFLLLLPAMVSCPAPERPGGAVVEKGLPASWDPGTGEGILWTADLGSESYGGPVVSCGKVFVGTNNEKPRDPAVTGDRGILMAFSAADGRFLWQAVHDKLEIGGESDWPLQGVCSTPAAEGDRIYYVSNRGELVAADAEGFLDGENDGPYTAETRHGPADADLIWVLDMPRELGVHPHRMSASTPLVRGDVVYALTSNGVDEKGSVPAPEAPSFIAVDRAAGTVMWESSAPGDRILEGQWSSPVFATLAGRPQVLFPGGDGWLYALDPATGAPLWKFDAGSHAPEAPAGGAAASTGPGAERESLVAAPRVDGDRVFIGVGRDPEKGAGRGRLWALRPAGAGDLTGTAPVWSLGPEAFSRTISTAAVLDGLVYAADLRGFLNCIEADTGRVVWSHDLYAQVWGSPLLADGKIYIGDEDGDVAVLRAGRVDQLLFETNMGNAVYTTPAAHDGVLYIATRARLFAVGAAR